MLLRPHREDVASIAFYLGRISWALAATGLIPAAVAAIERQWEPLGWFLTMIGVAAFVGAVTDRLRPPDNRHLRWGDGMVVVALAWLLVPAIGAIPFILSGHFGDPLDAFFESMSGFTTSGLSVFSDLDHSPVALTIWRQTTHFLGGQGIVLAALSVFAGGRVMALYHNDPRDERVFPSVRSAARFILLVALWHALLGIGAFWIIGVAQLGYQPGRALLHAYSIFVAAFDTGGFTPMSTSVAYYRSFTFEIVTMWLMLAGMLSFGVHYALWHGPRNVLKNLETKTLATSVVVTSGLVFMGLILAGTYTDVGTVVRRGFFQALSAHSTSGLTTVTAAELATWGGLAFAAVTTAMALGGMGSSASGGVKSLRVGLTIRTMADTIREVLLPEHSVIRRTYAQNGTKQLTPRLAQSVMAISLLFVAVFFFGALMGLVYGYPLQDALFESVSAASGVGLSVGITGPAMPAALELTYILLMWAGRLEFIAVFALAGFAVSMVAGE